MGQKVNPVGLRLGINRGWDSVWYAKKQDFGNYLIEDFKIREHIKKNVVNSGVSKVMIERTSSRDSVAEYNTQTEIVAPSAFVTWPGRPESCRLLPVSNANENRDIGVQ